METLLSLFELFVIFNKIGSERQNQDLGEDENRASNDDDTHPSNNSDDNTHPMNNARGMFI